MAVCVCARTAVCGQVYGHVCAGMRMDMCTQACVWTCIGKHVYGRVYAAMHMDVCVQACAWTCACLCEYRPVYGCMCVQARQTCAVRPLVAAGRGMCSCACTTAGMGRCTCRCLLPMSCLGLSSMQHCQLATPKVERCGFEYSFFE